MSAVSTSDVGEFLALKDKLRGCQKRIFGAPCGPMAGQHRPSGRDQDTDPPPEEEIVRLPADESVLAQQLEAMPSPVPERTDQLPFDQELDLLPETGSDPDAATEEPGLGWDRDGRGADKSTPMGWLALIGFLLLVLGGWASVTLFKGEARRESESRKLLAKQMDADQQEASARVLIERLEQLVTAYLGAPSVEEKSRFVRHPERVLPLMREFYQRQELLTDRFEAIETLRPAAVENYPFFGIRVKVEGKADPRLLLVEDCEDGELRFDWESEVNYQPMAISDYLQKKPTEAMDFRVYARLDTFYSYEFTNQDRYQALKLTFRDEDEYLFGYVERRSVEGRGLAALLADDKAEFPLLLRLRFLPNTESTRSVLVGKVLATSWVRVGKGELATQP